MPGVHGLDTITPILLKLINQSSVHRIANPPLKRKYNCCNGESSLRMKHQWPRHSYSWQPLYLHWRVNLNYSNSIRSKIELSKTSSCQWMNVLNATKIEKQQTELSECVATKSIFSSFSNSLAGGFRVVYVNLNLTHRLDWVQVENIFSWF